MHYYSIIGNELAYTTVTSEWCYSIKGRLNFLLRFSFVSKNLFLNF